eukprot:jgi/Chlat1/1996/Chrsp158S02296
MAMAAAVSASAGALPCAVVGLSRQGVVSQPQSRPRCVQRLNRRHGCARASAERLDGSSQESLRAIREESTSSLPTAAVALSAFALALLAADPAVAAEASQHPQRVLESDMWALAMAPENDAFWDNVRRYVAYFFTVASGSAYGLVKPIADLMKKPTTAVLTVIVLGGTGYLLSQALSAMLGLGNFEYQYPSI